MASMGLRQIPKVVHVDSTGEGPRVVGIFGNTLESMG